MPRNELTIVGREDLADAKADLRLLLRRLDKIEQVIPEGRRKRLLAWKSLQQGIVRVRVFADYNEREFCNGRV